ncbi:Protein of unknown function, partial [Gryllus bimaculatus]
MCLGCLLQLREWRLILVDLGCEGGEMQPTDSLFVSTIFQFVMYDLPKDFKINTEEEFQTTFIDVVITNPYQGIIKFWINGLNGRGSVDCPAGQHELSPLANAGTAATARSWAAAMLWYVCCGLHSRCAHEGPFEFPNQVAKAEDAPRKYCECCGLHNSAARKHHTASPTCKKGTPLVELTILILVSTQKTFSSITEFTHPTGRGSSTAEDLLDAWSPAGAGIAGGAAGGVAVPFTMGAVAGQCQQKACGLEKWRLQATLTPEAARAVLLSNGSLQSCGMHPMMFMVFKNYIYPPFPDFRGAQQPSSQPATTHLGALQGQTHCEGQGLAVAALWGAREAADALQSCGGRPEC